jgi:FtsZ-interacting cell division protein YlmF
MTTTDYMREYMRNRRATDAALRERERESARLYRERNREAIRERNKKYYITRMRVDVPSGFAEIKELADRIKTRS